MFRTKQPFLMCTSHFKNISRKIQADLANENMSSNPKSLRFKTKLKRYTKRV